MNSPANNLPPSPGRKPLPGEFLAITALLLLAAYFLAISWRKWPDPIADSGYQWFGFWRMSLGATLYHDVAWNYGPLSAVFFTFLFKLFGPGMMVVATANIIVYAAICVLAYLAFRRAWGWPGAFAALAVFISVFSFSRLNSIANYNYATPYASESTHGMLLILVATLVAVGWCRGASNWRAFALGLCGGLATVLKPEFMLATGVLGIAAFALRWLQKQRVTLVEILLALAGLIIPTLLFTLYFLRVESLKSALIDASQAWWLVVVERSQATTAQQALFVGADRPWTYAWLELQAALLAAIVLAALVFIGKLVNKSPGRAVQISLAALVAALVYFARPADGWLSIGSCFPGLIAAIFVVLGWRACREIRQANQISHPTSISLLLTLLAGTMLARMALHARVPHLGFYQAALAGMVIAAFLIGELPKWAGPNGWGKCLVTGGCVALLICACATIANFSRHALADQTLPVGNGRDRFYASAADIDPIGGLVDWSLDQIKSLPPGATVCVLPEGAMINYLSRHPSPLGDARSESQVIAKLSQSPPACVIFISRDLREFGLTQYGAPGGPGSQVLSWLRENHYEIAAQTGGNPLVSGGPKGAVVLRPKNPLN